MSIKTTQNNVSSTSASLATKKSEIFTTIGGYTAFMQRVNNTDTTNVLPSINNKKDIVPLLLDILKVVVGSDALQELIGNLFGNFIDKVEPQLKTGIKKQTTQYNSNKNTPNWFKSNTGLSIPIEKIDLYGKFKTAPDSAGGNLLYDSGGSDFDNSAYNAIKNGTSTFGGVLKMEYVSTSDSLIFSPLNDTLTIGEFTTGFVNDMTIVNKKQFVSEVMDSFYGSITSNQNKTVEQVYNELEINKLIEQLVNDDDSFAISPEDYETLLRRAQELIDGVVYYDLGCGLMGANFPLSGLTNLISTISGSTDTFLIGNEIANTLDESINDTTALDENRQTIKDGFFQRLIQIITQKLAQAITTVPQIQVLMQIYHAFQNNGSLSEGSITDVLKNMQVYLKCIIKDGMRLINEFIYNMAIKYLILLLNPVVRRIIREKINQFIGIIKNLKPIPT